MKILSFLKKQIIGETIINYIKDWLYQGQLGFLNEKIPKTDMLLMLKIMKATRHFYWRRKKIESDEEKMRNIESWICYILCMFKGYLEAAVPKDSWYLEEISEFASGQTCQTSWS